MLDTVVAAALEHVERAGDVGPDIGVGMIKRVTDAGLRREVDNPLGPLRGKHRLDHLTLGKVRLDEMESVAALEPPKTGLFERDIVVRAHIVEPNDLVAAVEQPGRSVETDEAGGAGNQNAHVVCSPLTAQQTSEATRAIRALPCQPEGWVTRPVDAWKAARYRPGLTIPRFSALSGIGQCRRGLTFRT